MFYSKFYIWTKLNSYCWSPSSLSSLPPITWSFLLTFFQTVRAMFIEIKQSTTKTIYVTTPPQLCRYCPFWGPYPSRFYSPLKHTVVGEKASTHWREVIPYKHILRCFPRRCGILWNARPSFLGHNNPPLARTFNSCEGFEVLDRWQSSRWSSVLWLISVSPIPSQKMNPVAWVKGGHSL